MRTLDANEVEVLRSLGGKGPPVKWGAWVSAVMESLHGLRLIQGESNGTLTDKGRAVLAEIEGGG